MPFPLKDRGLCKRRKILDLQVGHYGFGHIFGIPCLFFVGAFGRGCFPILGNNQPVGIHSFVAIDCCCVLPIYFRILLGVRSFVDDLRIVVGVLHNFGDLHILNFHVHVRDHGHRVHDRDRVCVRGDLRLNSK